MTSLVLTGPDIAAWLGSVGFGIVSAIVPIANAETYVVAAQMSTTAALPLAVAVGVGQSVGKTLLFLGVRRGKELPLLRRHRSERPPGRVRTPGRARQRVQAVVATLLALVGTKRWGLPIVFLAASVGLPPVYAVSLIAGATTMALPWFFLTVLVGRVIRFVLLALGAGSAILWVS